MPSIVLRFTPEADQVVKRVMYEEQVKKAIAVNRIIELWGKKHGILKGKI